MRVQLIAGMMHHITDRRPRARSTAALLLLRAPQACESEEAIGDVKIDYLPHVAFPESFEALRYF